MGAAASLHEPPVGGDLVGAVDGDVEVRDALERLHGEAQRAGRRLGVRRGRHAAQVEPALGQGGKQVGDRRSGPEADGGPVLDERRSGLGGDALLVFEVGHRAAAYPLGSMIRPGGAALLALGFLRLRWK